LDWPARSGWRGGCFRKSISSKDAEMLVVTRRENESTYLDLSALAPGIPPIRVVICEIKVGIDSERPSVRIGFQADPRIWIHRDNIKLKHSQHELYEPQETKGR
jgi:sRNA-binding carbon storage regulator CsrA